MFMETMTQGLAFPAAEFAPANYAANTCTNGNSVLSWFVGPVDMQKNKRAMGGVLANGGTTTACTITLTFTASANSNTTNATSWVPVAGGPSSVINFSGMMATIEMRADQMPSGTRYLAMLINNQCAGIFGGWIMGYDAAQKPAGQTGQNINTTQLVQAVM